MERGSRDADEAWQLMSALVLSERVALTRVAAALELTPLQAQALVLLDPDDPPCAVGTLGERLGTETSNTAPIVRRLEQLGYVERRPDPEDRRVRRLALTQAGRAARDRARAPLVAAPDWLLGLSAPARGALLGALREAAARAGVDAVAPPSRREAG